jgi:hypothetical protein
LQPQRQRLKSLNSQSINQQCKNLAVGVKGIRHLTVLLLTRCIPDLQVDKRSVLELNRLGASLHSEGRFFILGQLLVEEDVEKGGFADTLVAQNQYTFHLMFSSEDYI